MMSALHRFASGNRIISLNAYLAPYYVAKMNAFVVQIKKMFQITLEGY